MATLAGRTSAVALIGLLLVVLAGCAGVTESTTLTVGTPVAEPSPSASTTIDLTLLKSNFEEACRGLRADERFCHQLAIDGITAEGTTLIVPTIIAGSATEDLAAFICDQFVIGRFVFETGEEFGYEAIEILDLDGETAATCVVGD